MGGKVQALADALSGTVRLTIPEEAWSRAHVLNMLTKAGVPVVWEKGPLRVRNGQLFVKPCVDRPVREVVWVPDSEHVGAHFVDDADHLFVRF